MKMKLLLSGVLSVIAVAALAQPENPRLRQEMQQFYMNMDRMVSKGDVSGVLRTMDPSYVYVDRQGRHLSYSEVKSMVLGLKQSTKNAKSTTSVKHVAGTGDEAYAWIEVKTTFMVKDGRRWRTMARTHRFADTHRRTAFGWRTMMTQELPTDEQWMFGAGR